ncbi:hypothetical protein MTBBW1_850063 [Desulfamplus magnetovallimortis]|uniref:Uncharacterized protein n=1 Tax=Desulfamplus magnetovallimortis TaxID=1246637 RepID=A0A1W1HKY0_9BACT|nr:hypothetical protein MTBBW1_850063 [Desulfamplus magnetovallimortis]
MSESRIATDYADYTDFFNQCNLLICLIRDSDKRISLKKYKPINERCPKSYFLSPIQG